MGLLVVALAAGALFVDGGAPQTDLAATAPAAEEPADPGPPPTTAATPAEPAATGPVDNREPALYGWGSVQAYKMWATMEWGRTNEPLSDERRQLLGDQLQHAREVALEIGTVAEAERRGYVKNWARIGGRGYEYLKWENFKPELDLDNPTMLVFKDDKPDSRVISMAYNVLGTREDGPPTDLPLEVIPWHYHQNLCEVDGTVVGSVEYAPDGKPWPGMQERCDSLGATSMPWLNHWMVDLWVIPGWENPWGLISSKHPDLMDEPTPWFNGKNMGVEDDGMQGDGWALYCSLDGEDGAGGDDGADADADGASTDSGSERASPGTSFSGPA